MQNFLDDCHLNAGSILCQHSSTQPVLTNRKKDVLNTKINKNIGNYIVVDCLEEDNYQIYNNRNRIVHNYAQF